MEFDDEESRDILVEALDIYGKYKTNTIFNGVEYGVMLSISRLAWIQLWNFRDILKNPNKP